jgi:aerobic-type carbon monoxide dehydrogenase small subunit (CoxS/CutS family)
MTRLVVNGDPRDLAADPDTSLLWAVRDELGLRGTKYSCLEGVCGSCTLLVDGQPVRSCVTSLASVAGRSVETIEGLAVDGRLHPVQQGFVDELGFQCGFCTAGQIATAVGLLRRNPAPDDGEIREAMSDNVCRCCAYPRILRSVRRAIELTRGADPAGPEPRSGQGAAVGHEATPVAPPAGFLPRPARPWDLGDAPDRGCFDVLGDGLVAILPPVEESADSGETGGAWGGNGGAWLHVGEAGTVTAFSGKVDFGQDNRTALAMIVADALGVSPAAVRLVMGDTDVCPYDMGTFGSRSMPDAGTYLRGAAATARSALLGLAADRWSSSANELQAQDGLVLRRDGESIGYGALVRGLRQVVFADPADLGHPPATADRSPEERIVGRPTPKSTAREVVIGARQYGVDMVRPDMLIGAILRPPAFGATLDTVDVAAASAMTGVVTLVDGDFVGVAAPDLATRRAGDRGHRGEVDGAPAAVGGRARRAPASAPGRCRWLGRRRGRGDRRCRRRVRGGCPPARRDVYRRVHRPRASRDACRHCRMG